MSEPATASEPSAASAHAAISPAPVSCPVITARDITAGMTNNTLPADRALVRAQALIEARSTDHWCPACAIPTSGWTRQQLAAATGISLARVSAIAPAPRSEPT